MDISTFLSCLTAVTLLTLTPGVDTMLVIRNSGRGGWWDGAASSLGICCGLFVHAALSALGISFLLLQTAWAFSGLKLVGVLYLVWLGLTSLRNGLTNNVPLLTNGTSTSPNTFIFNRSIREGFLSNVLNPKTIIFYMAFLPQFINPDHSAMQQSLIVAAIHFSIGMVYQCLLAAMIDKARNWLKNRSVNRIFHGLTGTVFTYLGLRLAIDR